jgi:hypothetical protein
MDNPPAKADDVELRAGEYRREASAQAALAQELEQTLRVSDEARAQLSLALDKALSELTNTREGGAALRDRLAGAQEEIRRQAEEIARLQEQNKQIQALGQERVKLLAEVNRAMENAETVRREGIEALEEARELRKKAG